MRTETQFLAQRKSRFKATNRLSEQVISFLTRSLIDGMEALLSVTLFPMIRFHLVLIGFCLVMNAIG